MMVGVRVLILGNSLIAFLCAIVAYDVWVSGRRFVKGSLAWFLGFACLVPGIVLVSSADLIPPAVALGVGNLLLYFGASLQLFGLILHVGARPPHLAFFAPVLAASLLHEVLTFVWPSPVAAAALFNGFNVLVTLGAVGVLLRACPKEYRDSRIKAAITFCLFALTYLFRLVVTLPVVEAADPSWTRGAEIAFLLLNLIFLPSVAFAEFKLVNAHLMAELHEAAAEKALLVREMSHRTKNNLVLADSLVSLEASRFPDPGYRSSLEAIRLRLRSIGLLHDRLYRMEAVGRVVKLDEYLRDIVAALGEAAKPSTVEADLSSLEADIDVAIPVGLITAELVTNSAKYAYPGGGGRIKVSLGLDGSRVRLAVRDWGVGFASGSQEGLGSMILESLAFQLRAALRRYNEDGAVTEIVFSPNGPDSEEAS